MNVYLRNSLLGIIGFSLVYFPASYLISKYVDIEIKINSSKEIEYNDGKLLFTPIAENAVRVQYVKEHKYDLPDEWLYPESNVVKSNVGVKIDKETGKVKFIYMDQVAEVLLHELEETTVQDKDAYKAKIVLNSDEDEYLTGLGQFQDGIGNLRGVTRRLTQVNTQISIPFLLSNKGYGLLWNNYGLVDYNPSSDSVKMIRVDEEGEKQVVNVTSTEGTKKNCVKAISSALKSI